VTNPRGVFQRWGQEKLRSDFQNTRMDRVAVKVGVVQMEKVNDTNTCYDAKLQSNPKIETRTNFLFH